MIARLARLKQAARHFGVLLITLTVLLIALPLLEDRPYWDVLASLLADVVLIACLHAAQPGGRSM
jgi:bacteriorhodopsin